MYKRLQIAEPAQAIDASPRVDKVHLMRDEERVIRGAPATAMQAEVRRFVNARSVMLRTHAKVATRMQVIDFRNSNLDRGRTNRGSIPTCHNPVCRGAQGH